MKRDDFTLSLPLGHELIIDNFAGGGGTSTGLEAAFGRAVDIAINHAPTALAMSTITAASSNQQQVTAYLVTYYGNEKDGVSVGEPMHTLPTKPNGTGANHSTAHQCPSHTKAGSYYPTVMVLMQHEGNL